MESNFIYEQKTKTQNESLKRFKTNNNFISTKVRKIIKKGEFRITFTHKMQEAIQFEQRSHQRN